MVVVVVVVVVVAVAVAVAVEVVVMIDHIPFIPHNAWTTMSAHPQQQKNNETLRTTIQKKEK